VFVLIRQREHVHYVLLLLSILVAQTSFSGQLFRYVLPNHPLLANRPIGISLALVLMAIPMFARAVVRQGLSIARSLVRMHGGELWVESEVGQGSVFRFSLPRTLSIELPSSSSAA
jgi:hypothetical protein